MMYEEFCKGVGFTVSRDCYERIEAVYQAFDRFDSKEAIYEFYKKHDMNGIETLYEKMVCFNELFEQKKKLARELVDLQHNMNCVIGEMNKIGMLCGIHAV